MADRGGWDFFISYTQVNRPWAEPIAVQLEAATSLAACVTARPARPPSWPTRPSPVRCTTGSMTAFGCGGNAPGTASRAARPGARWVGYRRRHPAPAREGALMAENLDAERYR